MTYEYEVLTDPSSHIFDRYMTDTPDYGFDELYIPLETLDAKRDVHVEFKAKHTVFGKHIVTTYHKVITNRPVT